MASGSSGPGAPDTETCVFDVVTDSIEARRQMQRGVITMKSDMKAIVQEGETVLKELEQASNANDGSISYHDYYSH